MENLNFVLNLLQNDNVVSVIRQEQARLLEVIPELASMIDFEHCHPHHHLNVWEHTLLALSFAKNCPKIRLALLLHDVGKPDCYQQDGKFRHYRGHADRSAMMAKAITERLGLDENFVADIVEMVRKHDTPLCTADITANPSLARDIFEIQKCDALAHNPMYNQKRITYIAEIRMLIEQWDRTNDSDNPPQKM